jgi:PIN domain nuclease of toxin-antitoxin system
VSGYLLDSHVALWWLADEQLTEEASAAIADPIRPVFVSVATAWEIAIKQALDKLRVDDTTSRSSRSAASASSASQPPTPVPCATSRTTTGTRSTACSSRRPRSSG